MSSGARASFHVAQRTSHSIAELALSEFNEIAEGVSFCRQQAIRNMTACHFRAPADHLKR
jgi:hypothetical protein